VCDLQRPAPLVYLRKAQGLKLKVEQGMANAAYANKLTGAVVAGWHHLNTRSLVIQKMNTQVVTKKVTTRATTLDPF
jgi:hypothetical protein